ncbi:MAG: hypothetical protein K6C12_09970 [Oscillospiraceae bacterium]|nr:hypothetical protein [Oscillospiraceae bacterium]
MKDLTGLLFGKPKLRKKPKKKKVPLSRRLLDKLCSIPLKALEGRWDSELWDQRR